LNEHLAHDGESVFRHACRMGLEGIVSKRLDSRYRSGRSKDWLKFKNPEAPAVRPARLRKSGAGGGAPMANDEHVAILKKGVAAWNKWRDENPDIYWLEKARQLPGELRPAHARSAGRKRSTVTAPRQ
jgi:hypothetical protein